MKTSFFKFGLLPVSFMVLMPVYAAVPVNLMQHPISILNSLSASQSNINMIETRRSVDSNQTLHVRMKEMYQGYTVWGANAVMHVPQDPTKNHYMNGTIYQNLNADLENTPAQVDKSQVTNALNNVVGNYLHKVGAKVDVQNQKSELIVYVDKNNKAHWAYKISFHVQALKSGSPSDFI